VVLLCSLLDIAEFIMVHSYTHAALGQDGCLSWYKFVYTHLYHSRQLYNIHI